MRAALLAFALLLAALPAHAQRVRATDSVTFYVAPNGDDARNCLTPATACKTMQRAYSRAKYEYDFAPGNCYIKLADGLYTQNLQMAGQLVGTHLCQVNGNPANRNAVVINPGPDLPAFDVQDGAMLSVQDLRIEGTGVGIKGRQLVVLDIARITFGPLPNGVAIALIDQAGANINQDIVIAGDMVGFMSADTNSRIRVATDAQIIFAKPVVIPYFLMSYKKSVITFDTVVPIENPQFLSGLAAVACWDGTIVLNGTQLPGSVGTLYGGTVYP